MPTLVVEIGGNPVRLSAGDPGLLEAFRERYAGFVTDTPSAAPCEFAIQVTSERNPGGEAVRVTYSEGCWRFERGHVFRRVVS